MIFSQRLRYRFGDIDDAGIAYYPKLLHYFHCAFEDWWSDALGRPYPALLHDDELGLPAVHLDVDFYQPIRYGDEPIVHLGVLRIGSASVEFGFWMTRGDDPAPLCRARITTVAVDMATMQKQRLPDPWRARFAEYALAEADFPGGR
ncbi:MAG: acyl-CoA thioesterase [Planctomycetota bacterium]